MTIIRETKKALKIERDGFQFWVQKRWLKADGSLTPAGEKAFEEAKESAARGAAWEAKHGKGMIQMALAGDFKILRETEKAMQVAIEVVTSAGDDTDWKVWLPKTQTKVDDIDGLIVPRWLFDSKQKEKPSFLTYIPRGFEPANA